MTDFDQILSREIGVKEEDKKSKKSAKKKTGQSFSIAKKKFAIKKQKTRLATNKKNILSREAIRPIWLSTSEAAKLGGIDKKTIKRAIKGDLLKYKIVDNRYQVEFRSFVLFIASRVKLWNKLRESGIGQYIEKWVE